MKRNDKISDIKDVNIANDDKLQPVEEVVTNEKEPVKVLTVMERYATAPSVSHLLILIVSLLLIAVLITPNIAYIYYNGFQETNIIPFIDFPLAFLAQMGQTVEFPMSSIYPTFDSTFINGILMPMTSQVKNIYPFVIVCCGGLGALLFAICAFYSFVCVVGGVGRKQAVGLAYTLLFGGIVSFGPAIAMSIISVIGNGPTLWPLFPAIALLVIIALVIAVHVTYSKHIKNTISAKEYDKQNEAALKEELIKADAEIKENQEVKQVREDSINNKDSIIEEVIAQNKERDLTKEACDADDNLVEDGKIKVEEIHEVPVEHKVIIEEKPAPVVVEEVKKSVPVPPKHVVKVPVNNDIDPTKGLSVLPEGTTELGDHAYSKNLELEFAIIPEGIEKIGPACFANCLNLKMVQLPKSLQKISFNGFFACKKLTKIVYNGTKVEWKKIVRGSNWLTSAGTKVIICKDGAISVNPFH